MLRIIPYLAVAAAVATQFTAAQERPGASPSLVSTWTLVSVEPPAAGQPQGRGGQNARGLLVFDSAGHVFEAVSRSAGQTAGGTQAAASDSRARFASFAGFWGTYKVDAPNRKLTFRPEGAVSPAAMGREFARSFEPSGDRLVVTAQAGEPHTAAGTRWTWERVPVVENLSPGYRQVVGFWQHVVEKRVNLTTGASISESRRAPSIIVYTPSGYVGVHFPPLNRQPFAGDAPTEEEARAALMGYVGYFGALTVYPGMVFHHILAGITQGGTLKRFYELSGNEVTLRFPPTTNQGQQVTTLVTAKRLSGAAEMVPK